MKGKNILVIDDVITAGTAIRETLDIITKENGKVIGFIVALDRMEKIPGPREKDGFNDGESRISAMGQITQEYGVRTSSIITLNDLIAVLKEKGNVEEFEKMEAYRERYRASD